MKEKEWDLERETSDPNLPTQCKGTVCSVGFQQAGCEIGGVTGREAGDWKQNWAKLDHNPRASSPSMLTVLLSERLCLFAKFSANRAK